MSEQIEVVMKRYAARNYAGSESVKRGHDAYAIADHACEVMPKLVEQRDELRAACEGIVSLALDAFEYWDDDQDHKVGKILSAIAGRLKGYRPECTALHAALAKAKS